MQNAISAHLYCYTFRFGYASSKHKAESIQSCIDISIHIKIRSLKLGVCCEAGTANETTYEASLQRLPN